MVNPTTTAILADLSAIRTAQLERERQIRAEQITQNSRLTKLEQTVNEQTKRLTESDKEIRDLREQNDKLKTENKIYKIGTACAAVVAILAIFFRATK